MEITSAATSALLLHRRLLQQQSDHLQGNFDLDDSDDAFSINSIPSFLEKRLANDDNQSRRRLVDDVELTLLGILNSEGIISLSSRVQELIVVMTRLTKVDHRALFLHVVATAMTLSCGQCFVEYGGMRILRRWIEAAEFEENIEELKQIVVTCRKLPFNSKVVKETEIGKVIKKLLKFQPSEENVDVTSLRKEVKALMECWSSKAQAGITVEGASPTSIADVDRANSFVKAVSSHIIAPNTSQSDQSNEIQANNFEGDYSAASSPRSPQSGADSLDDHSHSPHWKDSSQTHSTSLSPSTAIVRRLSNEVIEGKEGDPLNSHMDVDGSPDKGTTLPHSDNDIGELLSTSSSGVGATKEPKQSSLATSFGLSAKPSQPTKSLPFGTIGGGVGGTGRPAGGSGFFAGGGQAPVTITIRPRVVSRQADDDRAKPGSGAIGSAAAASTGNGLSGAGALGSLGDSGNAGLASKGKSDRKSKVDFGVGLSVAASSKAGGASGAAGRSNGGSQSAQQPALKSALKGSKRALDFSSSSLTDSGDSASGSAGSDSSSAPAKRVKMSVKWCDTDASGPLEEVRTFEVERIKKNLDHYKNIKDQEKREREKEREAHVQKISDAMHPTQAWNRPIRLSLPIQVQESVPDRVESTEKEVQTKRISLELEVRYVDDSLIPNEPDSLVDPAAAMVPPVLVAVPWANEAVPEPAEPQPGASMERDFFDNPQIQAIIKELPPSLQNLERDILRMVLEDTARINFIMNPDFTVNPEKVDILRHQFREQQAAAAGAGSGSGGYFMGDRFQRGPQFGFPGDGNGGDAPRGVGGRRSRWSAPSNDGAAHRGGAGDFMPGGGGDFMPGGFGPEGHELLGFPGSSSSSSPMRHQHHQHPGMAVSGFGGGGGMNLRGDRGDPYGMGLPPIAAGMGMFTGPEELFDDPRDEGRRIRGGPGSREAAAAQRRRFPTTKAATPCRFFNTPKGCQFGDKCAFGHFRDDPELAPHGPGPVSVPGIRPGPGRPRMGLGRIGPDGGEGGGRPEGAAHGDGGETQYDEFGREIRGPRRG